MKWKFAIAGALALAAAAAQAQGITPGVTAEELTVGTIQDLSGPLAQYGKQIRMGLQMRAEEANEQGGINGRRIKLLVEDNGYDPKKAVLATQKLVEQGKGIFAMVAHFGSPHNVASMPVLLEKNVINYFPVSSAREMYEPLHKLKYSNSATYYDQMRIAAPRLMTTLKLNKACIMYQDDDYGIEVLRGTEAGLKSIGKELVEKTSYKRGATDFSSQVARMKAAGCELVVLGTILRETVGSMSEARKAGFNPAFVGPNGVYGDLVHKLGGKAVEGLYCAMTWEVPYLDSPEQAVRFWAQKYKTKFGEDPTVLSVIGYQAMDSFVKVAGKAGRNLTTDAFAKAMENTAFDRDMFGGPEMSFSAKSHLGNRFSRLSQIQDGRWKVVSDYVEFSGLKKVPKKGGGWTYESEYFKGE